MDIKYDTPIEVSKEQYKRLIIQFAGVIAHRNENGRYWIKIWLMRFKEKLQHALT